MHFDTQTALALEAAFDGGRITSDSGLVERAQGHAGVAAATEDEAGIVKHRDVEKISGDRGEERDQVQHAKNSCYRLRMIDLDSFPR